METEYLLLKRDYEKRKLIRFDEHHLYSWSLSMAAYQYTATTTELLPTTKTLLNANPKDMLYLVWTSQISSCWHQCNQCLTDDCEFAFESAAGDESHMGLIADLL